MKCTLREWQHQQKSLVELIVQASAMDGSDSWQPWPIGMGYEFLSYLDEFKRNQSGDHKETVLCCFIAGTDERRRRYGMNRRKIEYELHKRGIYNLPFVRKQTYWKALLDHKFIVSPEGNGIDCHRHYEALMAGCIPIVEDNPLIKEKYAGCPILYTKNYLDITDSYLRKKYDEMLDQTYDFSCLFLSHYTEDQQRQIKECGNYWLKKLAGKEDYYLVEN
ncbi:MAG: hypothetical protein EBU82_05160 [Flavobacteriia bacterium]|jgi:hypothetical protein|nr:hypothetical protein [Flavobacteriia bacterium]